MIDTLLTILGNYVFPIAACCAMAFFVKYMYDQTNGRIDKLNEQHKNEVDNLSEVIKNNTIALEKMNSLIERLEK
nr:MAG TPA_asm: YvrJ protein family protein [Caudoviricetes sp.]